MKNRKNTKPAEMRSTEELHEQIGLCAYYIWLTNGGGYGNDLQHWLQAEEEIGARTSASIADPRNPKESQTHYEHNIQSG